jgi:hypothetical protein
MRLIQVGVAVSPAATCHPQNSNDVIPNGPRVSKNTGRFNCILRSLGLKEVHRALFAGLEDVFMLPSGERGDRVDRLLSGLIEKLRSSGRLEKLYADIHLPYDPWQP